ncbi:retrovirus-related pol polyprotein from transposon TNT 1-94 [Tanacetum coccineum]
MSGTIPPIPPPFKTSSGNPDKRLKSIIIFCLPNDVMKSVIKCKTAKEMWNDLILAHEGQSNIRDTKIAALRLKFNAFKSLEGEKLNGTSQAWPLCMDSDSNVEEDQRTINEIMADLNVEFHERALLANQKRFYKRSGRVGSARKPLDKSKETCFACGKLDYKEKYKGLKAEMAVLTKKIDDMTKEKSEKGKKEKGKYEKEDKPSVRKVDARSGQWVDITMKKVHRLLSMIDGDERKHVLDYTHVDLHYVENQKKKLVNKFNLLKQEISLHKSELSNLKSTVSINILFKMKSLGKVTLDQLLSEQVPGNIVKALGGKGKRKEKIYSKEEPLPPFPKLIGAAPSGTLESLISLSDLTLNMADLTLDTPVPKKTRPSVKVSPAYVIKKKIEKSPAIPKPCSDKKADSSTEQLLLTLMEEAGVSKGKLRSPQAPLHQAPSQPKCSTYGSTDHLTKEHLEHAAVKKTLSKLKAQSPLKPSPKKAPTIPKPFKECKYCGFNDHHSDHCEFYPGCEDYLKSSVWYLDSDFSRHMTGIKQYLHRYSKESGPKVVLEMILQETRKVLFTKTQRTIYNQNDEVVLIAPRRRDVYVIDMSSFNKERNAYFFAKASPSINWLWHKRLSHLNFKNINNVAKHNLVSGLPSLVSLKTKIVQLVRKGSITEHHSKERDQFLSTSLYISSTWICLDLSNLKPSATTNIPLPL